MKLKYFDQRRSLCYDNTQAADGDSRAFIEIFAKFKKPFATVYSNST